VTRFAGAGAVLAMILALVASSLLLITAQHRTRGLFIELEREQQAAQRLQAESNRLRIELSRASQPAKVEAAALAMGMRRVEMARTAFLPLPRQISEAPR
jgi:cell division protein FtsL